MLDIGSGWGGLGLYLAEMTGADVTGITLSSEQLQVANARAAEKNLAGSAKFLLSDYRDIPGPFDRIVSVGMFEHVGVGFYETYFRRCAELLSDDGVMVLHAIGRSTGPDVTSPWTTKYIFPGGYIPAISEVIPAIEKAGLLVCDIEILRLHYAETLKAWRERFMARREEAVRLYDERFARMWEFYLAASEMSFRKQNLMNFQIQLDQAPRHRADDARLHRAGRSEAARGRTGKTAAAAVGGRIAGAGTRSLSSAGCRARRKECKATPDGQAAHARRQAPAGHKARHAVPGAKSLPWCRSAATATSAGCLPIAIPGVADPSPVLLWSVAIGNPKAAGPFPIS